MLPAVVQAQFQFVTNNGTIIITGYTGSGYAVTIPSTINGLPVSSIGDEAFFYAQLTRVTIPNSVISIGAGAFAGCYLTAVTLPNSVTSIGDGAFRDCWMTNVTIPYSVTNIGGWAFGSCINLSAITVDEHNLFYSSLNGDLYNKNQTTLVECLGVKAGTYIIPSSVVSIGYDAFYWCSKLTCIVVPNSVTSIDSYGFASCTSLTNITIPNSVTNIGRFALGNCTKLTDIKVDTLNSLYSSLDGVLFNKNQTTLIECPGGKAGTYIIPNSVTRIGEEAFIYSCLTNVTIGNNVTIISMMAFYGCSNLTGIYFRGDAPDCGWDSFYNDGKATLYYLPGTTGWGGTYEGRPTALWRLSYPLILNNGHNFGVRTNRFGFTVSWATNIPVVVESCTNLANLDWSPVSTNTLTNGSAYFSDPYWTNYPSRFYRIRSP